MKNSQHADREVFPIHRSFFNAILALTVTLLLSGIASAANTNNLDPNFNVGSGLNNSPRAMVLQPDGKILVGGHFQSFNGVTRYGIVRLHANGSLDTSFTPATSQSNDVSSILLQPDGKIIIGGILQLEGRTARLARLNPNGSLDTSFSVGSGETGEPYAMALQPDGKLIVGSNGVLNNNTLSNTLRRFNPDGSSDTTFKPGTGPNSTVMAVALMADGRVIIGGYFNQVNGTSRIAIARLNSDGSLDSFNPTIPVERYVSAIAIQPDGRILIAGSFYAVNDVFRRGIARLNPDGSLDGSFNPGTGTGQDAVRNLILYPNGKILITGLFFTFNDVERKFIARLNPNGSLDTNFELSPGANNWPIVVVLQPDNKILLGGFFTSINDTPVKYITRLDASAGALSFSSDAYSFLESEVFPYFVVTRTGGTDGKVIAKVVFKDNTTSPADYRKPSDAEPSFSPAFQSSSNFVSAAAIQPDGKLFIGGGFQVIENEPRNGFARLNSDGTLDRSYVFNAEPSGIEAIAVQPDGKAIIVGNLGKINGVARNRIARLNLNGSLDTSFNPSLGDPNNFISWVVVQPDSKILICGYYNFNNGVKNNFVYRLNPNGSFDSTFNFGSEASGRIERMLLQPDGKIIINGVFREVKGALRPGIARLNSDGSLDTTFVPSFIPPAAVINRSPITLQPDGKILVGSCSLEKGIVRVNPNGSLDSSFNPGTGANCPGNGVQAIGLQPDGKIIIGGYFSTFSGIPVTGMARLSANGSFDNSFRNSLTTTSTGTMPGVSTILVQPDGKVFISGNFNTINGVTRNRTARLEGDRFITWLDGEATTKLVTIPIVDDLLDEADEKLNLSLTPVTGQPLITPNASALVTIKDDDTPPAFISPLPHKIINEKFHFSHSFAATGWPTPTYSVTGGSLPPGLSLSSSGWLAGVPSVPGTYSNITVTAQNGVSSPVSQTFSIKVNAWAVAVGDTYTIDEDAQLKVSAAQGVLANDTDFEKEPLTAVLSSTTNLGTLDFKPDGSFTYTPRQNVNADSFSYYVYDGHVNSNPATVFIKLNPVNDAPINYVPDTQTIIENGARTFSSVNGNLISVSDPDGANFPVRVSLTATNGTLTLSEINFLTFTEGDGIDDARMTFSASLPVINARLNRLRFNSAQGFSGVATIQVLTDDLGNWGSGGALTDTDTININVQSGGTLQFGASGVVVNEGDGNLQVTITRTDGSAGSTSVSYATGDGTAKAGTDYTHTSGTVTFGEGETSKTFTVPLLNDTVPESGETINLTLSDVTGSATLGTPSTAVLTILDNDAATIEFSSSSYSISEDATNTPQGFGSLTVDVVRIGDISAPVTVQYFTSDQSGGNECNQMTGKASQRCDYAAVGGTLRFAANETSKSLSVPIINDGYREGDETFFLALQNPVGATLGAIEQAPIVIQDSNLATTPATNLYLSNEFFVRMNYLDFLGREPDTGGWSTWTSALNQCGPEKGFLGAPPDCDRAHVSHGFFGSPEFTDTGFLIYRMYEVGMNRLPRYTEFTPDMASLSGFGLTDAIKQQNLQDYLQRFTAKQEFITRFQGALLPTQASALIQKLEQTAGVTLPATATTLPGQSPQYSRSELIVKRQTGQLTLGQTLKAFVEQKVVYDKYFPRGQVTMLYFAYLKRDPDLNDPNLNGWNEWVFVFTNGGAQRGRPDIQARDIHHLIFGFIYSEEYRKRFGQP